MYSRALRANSNRREREQNGVRIADIETAPAAYHRLRACANDCQPKDEFRVLRLPFNSASIRDQLLMRRRASEDEDLERHAGSLYEPVSS
jgi:hypothetical protein